MERQMFWAWSPVAILWLACSACLASEAAPSVDSVLAKWEDASQNCKSLDAKLTVYRYDSVFGHSDRPTILHGRVYYEAPNLGYYEIRDGEKGVTHGWSNVSEAFVWTGKQILWIEGQTGCCRTYSLAKVKALLSQPQSEEEWWLPAIFSKVTRAIAHRGQGPQQIHPLLLGIRAAEVRERFQVTIESSGETVFLKAVPKQSAEQSGYSEIHVILNGKTYLAVATKEVSVTGRDWTVYALSDPKVNQHPSDRDQLLAPDLSKLKIIEEM